MKKSAFPIFNNSYDKLVYLDNAATTHKPQVVLDSLSNFYTNLNSNVHRSVYPLSEMTTEAYEHTRDKIAKYINASSRQEIIFTKSTTESINLVAYAWGESNIQAGDEIIVSILEHHSNFFPWQQLVKRKGAILKVIPLDENNFVTIENVRKCLSGKTKIVAITHVSNVTGSIQPVRNIISAAHLVGAKVLIDAAQSIAHIPIDVRDLDCDWLVFSGHKMYGPTGVGVLYGKKEILESMPPFLFGGGMVHEFTEQKTEWSELPCKFEAGTPPIAEVVALAASINFLEEVGLDTILQYEKELTKYTFEKLNSVDGLNVLSTFDMEHCGGVISFTVKGSHPHDVATLVGEQGICIRAGHHCAKPLHNALNISASCRISLAIYNSREDIDMLIKALSHAKKILDL